MSCVRASPLACQPVRQPRPKRVCDACLCVCPCSMDAHANANLTTEAIRRLLSCNIQRKGTGMGGNFTNRTSVASGNETRDDAREANTRIPKQRTSAERTTSAQARGRYARTKRLLDAGYTPQQAEPYILVWLLDQRARGDYRYGAS